MRKLLMVGCIVSAAMAGQEENTDRRLQDAAAVVDEMMGMPDKGVPHDLLHKAQCIAIIPGLKKAAFVVGGQYGRGFASCRKPGAGWGPPAAMRMEGGSFGLQLGAQSTDIILLVMNQRGMNRLTSDKFTLGVDAAIAAGPVGRNAQADTDVLMMAEILAWSRSRGVFAGISLQGATLRPDQSENKKIYGRKVRTKEVLSQGLPTPGIAKAFVSALNRAGK
jgi:lipid-binding SYLF domain-containing protein